MTKKTKAANDIEEAATGNFSLKQNLKTFCCSNLDSFLDAVNFDLFRGLFFIELPQNSSKYSTCDEKILLYLKSGTT